jgi:hypothetical protein
MVDGIYEVKSMMVWAEVDDRGIKKCGLPAFANA